MSERLILKELSRYPIGAYPDIIYRNAVLNAESCHGASVYEMARPIKR